MPTIDEEFASGGEVVSDVPSSGDGDVGGGGGGAGAVDAGGDGAHPAVPAGGATEPGSELTIRSYLQANGVRADQFQDDYAALNYLIGQQREAERLRVAQSQMDAYAQIGRQLQPHVPAIQQYLQEQQKPAGPKVWESPPFDEKWTSLVTQDPSSGVFVGKPGTPIEIVDAVNRYADWQRNYQRNPAAVMSAMMADREEQLVSRIRQQFEQRFERQALESRVQSIVAQNASWFYQRDAGGNVLRDPVTQGPLASPVGQQYLQVVGYIDGLGVKDPVSRDALAKLVLRAELAAAQAPAGPVGGLGAAQQRAAVSGRPNRSPLSMLGAQERRETARVPEEEAQGRSLSRMLKDNMVAAGLWNNESFDWHAG